MLLGPFRDDVLVERPLVEVYSPNTSRGCFLGVYACGSRIVLV